ncbi:AAA family ATPase [Algoriphagus machipongonensis]|uniref:RecF/RecN/SMC N domain protein n=1 Tax=Algoriphagus machipongonensis TaxID=388413 RepID=A3HX95_9BACT|nr:SMC family ATPase [Algoriphagus machipongonensis]EAZ81218.1 putative RecF/RecN/SMC N domain protein [Algoriphagus machipongonensis]
MIPIRLEIQGLYSYREKQVIEFDQLTAAGLFGIFGAVGSGKSSILEGILLALYGSTERLSDRGEKNSMLNLQSEELIINFEFQSGKNNVNTYLGRYAAKRNPKKFEEVRPAEHTFYEKVEGQWEPISAKAEEIIGMKKEHFKQTVIIPQGKFREFIDLTPGPRAEMMKELFGLERFDLSGKTGSLLKVVKEEKIRLETQLSGLEGFSKEILEEKSNSQKIQKKDHEELMLKLQLSETQMKQQEEIQKKAQQLKVFQTNFRELSNKKPEIEEKRLLHKEFITAKTYLKPIWDQIHDTQKELEKYTTSVVDCERFKLRYIEEVKTLEDEEVELKSKNQQRPDREAKIRDLKKVLEVKRLQVKLDEANQKLETLKPELESKKASQNQLEAEVSTLEKQSEDLESPDIKVLSELQTALRDWGIWEEDRAKLEKIKKQLQEEIVAVKNNLEQIFSKLPSEEKSLETWQKSQKQLILNLESERDQVMQKQGLGIHVHLLEDGKPCPLCGAVEHPSPLKSEKEKVELKAKNEEINQEKNKLEGILTLIQKEKENQIHLENHQRNSASKEEEILKIEKSLETMMEMISSHGISDASELKEKVVSLTNAGRDKEKIQQQIKSLRQSWNSQRGDIEQIEKSYQTAQLSQNTVFSSISSKKEEIKDPTFCKQFFSKTADQIEATILKVEADIEEAIKLLEGKQKVLREKREAQASNLTSLKGFEKLKADAQSKLETLRAEYEKQKVKFGFENEAALVRLFEHSLDAEKVDLEIRDFDQKFAITESRINELKAEDGVLEFNEIAFEELKELVIQLKENASSSQNSLLLLSEEIKTIQSQLENKKLLLETFGQLENRESNLKELERLFKGSGFVKYVSSIYLKELCNTANVRFMKLSKNSLSLEIDDDNTFWVIDYLNGGKRRLLKTLSGGQTFQASLCLALALAEKVKALNQADQSFFFLDEGFGALDRNALRVVFETLKSLRHENRIVGIISHVEELQQEIGVYAQITLDPEKGSQVAYSY